MGCSNGYLHPPTTSEVKIDLSAGWYGKIAKLLYETKRTYHVSAGASDMLWIETAIENGWKEGYIVNFEQQRWVREFWGNKLIKGPSSVTQEEVETQLRAYGRTNPPPLKIRNAGDLVYKFNFNRNSWEKYWIEGGARVKFTFSESALTTYTLKSHGVFYHIQLYKYGLTLEKDRSYILRLSVKATEGCELLTKFHKYPPDIDLQTPQFCVFELSKGYNTVEASFTATRTTNAARLTLFFGQIDEGTELVINGLELYKTTG